MARDEAAGGDGGAAAPSAAAPEHRRVWANASANYSQPGPWRLVAWQAFASPSCVYCCPCSPLPPCIMTGATAGAGDQQRAPGQGRGGGRGGHVQGAGRGQGRGRSHGTGANTTALVNDRRQTSQHEQQQPPPQPQPAAAPAPGGARTLRRACIFQRRLRTVFSSPLPCPHPLAIHLSRQMARSKDARGEILLLPCGHQR